MAEPRISFQNWIADRQCLIMMKHSSEHLDRYDGSLPDSFSGGGLLGNSGHGHRQRRLTLHKRGIVLRGISLGSLEILRQPVHPLPTAESSAVGICLPAEHLRMHEQRRGARRAPSRCRENQRRRLDKHAGRRLY